MEAQNLETKDQRTPQTFRSFFGYLKHTDPWISVLFMLFVCISIYSVITASGSEVYEYIFKGGGLFSPITKQFIIVLLSVTVAYLMPVLQTKWLRHIGMVYVVMCLGLFALLMFNGQQINQAERWISIMGISVQPSEFGKLGLIFSASWLSCRYVEAGSPTGWAAFRSYYLWGLIGLFIIIFFIGSSNVSTALIYLALMALLFFIYKMPMRWFALIFGSSALAGLFGLVAIYLMPSEWAGGRLATVKARIERKLSSDQEDKFIINDKNRQEQYARIALANSRISGQFFGQSRIKDHLPMAMSDYIYVVLIEEGGVLALILIPLLYVWWFWLAGSMAKREESLFCRYILYGIGILFPLQALVNFIVASGILTTGQPLPFLSAGGSSFLANSLVVGIMLIISRGQYERRARKANNTTPNTTEHPETTPTYA